MKESEKMKASIKNGNKSLHQSNNYGHKKNIGEEKKCEIDEKPFEKTQKTLIS